MSNWVSLAIDEHMLLGLTGHGLRNDWWLLGDDVTLLTNRNSAGLLKENKSQRVQIESEFNKCPMQSKQSRAKKTFRQLRLYLHSKCIR